MTEVPRHRLHSGASVNAGDQLGSLIDPAEQGAVVKKSDGLGMGLYAARAIVEAHGGTIALASTEAGTEVGIRLGRVA